MDLNSEDVSSSAHTGQRILELGCRRCERPSVGAGNQAQGLRKSSRCPYLLRTLQSCARSNAAPRAYTASISLTGSSPQSQV